MSPPSPQVEVADEPTIRQMAAPMGFALLGVAPAEPSPHRACIEQWLADEHHGEMGYLARNLETRIDPRRFLPGARSVISVADIHPATEPDADAAPFGTAPRGRVARYAWGDDYHETIKRRLHALADQLRRRWPDDVFRSCVDTAPTLEREHALLAGLGWIGKHTLLIHPRLGSWLLLGQIVTTLPIEPEAARKPVTDHCGTCTRCIDACPTDCIAPSGYSMDADRCISYLTIEHRGPIDRGLQEKMVDWIAGCDVCQEVCPFNEEGRPERSGEGQPPAYQPQYATRPPGPTVSLLEILGWSQEDRRAAFRKSALKRIKLDQLKRNALIAAGNHLAEHEDQQLEAKVRELAEDEAEAPLVRETARQVLERLQGVGGSG